MVIHLDSAFEAAYEAWIAKHLKESKGERKRKLLNGISHAQKLFLIKIWWPLFGHLHELIPELEIRDFKDGYRYLDFAWLLPNIKIVIEIDGFGPHWRNVDRWQFADHLYRQNHLILDDWIVLRFSYDEIMEHPRRCQQLILQANGKWGRENSTASIDPNASDLDPIDRAILAFASQTHYPFSPSTASKELGWHRTTINRRMLELAKSGYLTSASRGKKRTRYYTLSKPS